MIHGTKAIDVACVGPRGCGAPPRQPCRVTMFTGAAPTGYHQARIDAAAKATRDANAADRKAQ